MNLYLLSQYVNTGDDTYDSMVVCAKHIIEAKQISMKIGNPHNWVIDEKHILCKLIREADKTTACGLVLSSYNPG